MEIYSKLKIIKWGDSVINQSQDLITLRKGGRAKRKKVISLYIHNLGSVGD